MVAVTVVAAVSTALAELGNAVAKVIGGFAIVVSSPFINTYNTVYDYFYHDQIIREAAKDKLISELNGIKHARIGAEFVRVENIMKAASGELLEIVNRPCRRDGPTFNPIVCSIKSGHNYNSSKIYMPGMGLSWEITEVPPADAKPPSTLAELVASPEAALNAWLSVDTGSYASLKGEITGFFSALGINKAALENCMAHNSFIKNPETGISLQCSTENKMGPAGSNRGSATSFWYNKVKFERSPG